MAREMKDSGIEWIAEIPKEWEIKRIKYVAEFEPKCNMNELNNDSIVTYLPMECLKNGYFEKRERNLGDLPTSLTHFQENDIVMAKVTPCFENGNIAIMQKLQSGFGLGSSELFVLRCKTVNIHYLFWWLQNRGFVSQACSTMTGTGGLKRVSPYFIKNCTMHMPPEIEQVRISNFLYAQCEELDNVHKKTCASIEEYKKLKQAVITQAVTKGIRGSRELKDSGIEWIGEIPVEWEERRIKTLFNLRKERNFSPLEEVNLISLYTDLGVVQHSELEKTTGNKASNADGYKTVYRDDIVVNIILCWMGAIGRSEYNGVTSPAYDVYIPRNEVLSKFYHYYFRTKGFSGDCYKRGKGIMAMRWRTYSDQFRDIRVVYPSLEEQREIVNYLDQKCAAIDELIAKKEQYLSEIENYKKSLIYEYVTGKKEVPQE
jgi:type I restriction enzyme S subunit